MIFHNRENGCDMKVANTAVQLQGRLRIAAYPMAHVAWHVHPPGLAKTSYIALSNILLVSLSGGVVPKQSASADLVASILNFVQVVLIATSGALGFIIFINPKARQLDRSQLRCRMASRS